MEVSFRLQRDFDLNVSGVVLVLELLEELESLRSRLGMLETDGKPPATLDHGR